MNRTSYIVLLLLLLLLEYKSSGQELSRDSVKQILKSIPSFNIYRDNYFITGIPLDRPVTENTADAKFQISFVQRLTNAILPFNSYFLLTYTQRSFWDIYKFSSPFAETNYNPGIGIGKLLFKDNKLSGILILQVEHESNGRDSIYSRSWNFVSATLKTSLSRKVNFTLKGWIPYWYGDNADLPRYIGFGEARLAWMAKKHRLIIDIIGRKGAAWNWNGNLQAQICFKPFTRENQFVVLQWYQGYGESLIDYNKSVSYLRLGFLIRPNHFSYY